MLEEIRQKIIENNNKIDKLKEDNKKLEINFSKILFIGKRVNCFPYSKDTKGKTSGIVKGFYLSDDNEKILVDIEHADCDGDLSTQRFNILEITDY